MDISTKYCILALWDKCGICFFVPHASAVSLKHLKESVLSFAKGINEQHFKSEHGFTSITQQTIVRL